MFSLVNRGLIPRDVDLGPAFERGMPPVQVNRAPLNFGNKYEDAKSRRPTRQRDCTMICTSNSSHCETAPLFDINSALSIQSSHQDDDDSGAIIPLTDIANELNEERKTPVVIDEMSINLIIVKRGRV
jgi:hypothetical protein